MDRKNVLFILVDDLGWGDVSYHGSEIRTPNIDRLVQNGVELDQHYVAPVCTPTRTAFMSGKQASRFGMHATLPTNDPVLPDGYRTIASMFRDAGYATGLFGKWHLGSDPAFYPGKYGFDYSYGSLAGGVDPYVHRYKEGPYSYTWHRNGERVDEVGHATELITDEASWWIENQERPWFCYVPYTAVHTPVKAPEQWIDRYSDRQYDEDPARDRSFKVYAAYTSHMDACIGQLIETLKVTNQLEDTIVVVTSDNGAVTYNPSNDTMKYPGYHEDTPRLGSNGPLRGHKAQMYEGGIRTPAVISCPGTLRPRKICQPMHIVDWMPTFSSWLRLDESRKSQKENGEDTASHTTYESTALHVQHDGQDVSALIRGEVDHLADRPIYWNMRHQWFAIRYGHWKLIVRYNSADKSDEPQQELYNIDTDPYEETNCLVDYPQVAMELKQMIEEQHRLDDSCKRDDMA